MNLNVILDRYTRKTMVRPLFHSDTSGGAFEQSALLFRCGDPWGLTVCKDREHPNPRVAAISR